MTGKAAKELMEIYANTKEVDNINYEVLPYKKRAYTDQLKQGSSDGRPMLKSTAERDAENRAKRLAAKKRDHNYDLTGK